MKVVREFKAFVVRGNVIDLAVGIIIGSAFGKIVSSLVADVFMPPLGLLIGGINFTDIKVRLKDSVIDASGKVTAEAVNLNVGNFIQTAFDFIIIAFAIFIVIRTINKIKTTGKEVAEGPSKEETLLTEIRDILKQK